MSLQHGRDKLQVRAWVAFVLLVALVGVGAISASVGLMDLFAFDAAAIVRVAAFGAVYLFALCLSRRPKTLTFIVLVAGLLFSLGLAHLHDQVGLKEIGAWAPDVELFGFGCLIAFAFLGLFVMRRELPATWADLEVFATAVCIVVLYVLNQSLKLGVAVSGSRGSGLDSALDIFGLLVATYLLPTGVMCVALGSVRFLLAAVRRNSGEGSVR